MKRQTEEVEEKVEHFEHPYVKKTEKSAAKEDETNQSATKEDETNQPAAKKAKQAEDAHHPDFEVQPDGSVFLIKRPSDPESPSN